MRISSIISMYLWLMNIKGSHGQIRASDVLIKKSPVVLHQHVQVSKSVESEFLLFFSLGLQKNIVLITYYATPPIT